MIRISIPSLNVMPMRAAIKQRLPSALLAAIFHVIPNVVLASILFRTGYPSLPVIELSAFMGVFSVAFVSWLLPRQTSATAGLSIGIPVTLISIPLCYFLVATCFGVANWFEITIIQYDYDRPQTTFRAMIHGFIWSLPWLIYLSFFFLPLNIIVAAVIGATMKRDLPYGFIDEDATLVPENKEIE